MEDLYNEFFPTNNNVEFDFTYNNHRYITLPQYVKISGKRKKKIYNNDNELKKIIDHKDKIHDLKNNNKRRVFSEKEKIYLFRRQFNYFCGNYPNSILSEIIGFHCSSYDHPYNSFKSKSQDFFEIEHLIQYSRGGKDNFSNCYLLCSNCHKIKTGKEKNKLLLQNMEDIFKKEKYKVCKEFKYFFLKNMKEYINYHNFHNTHPEEIEKFNDIINSIDINGYCILKHDLVNISPLKLN